VQPVTAHRTRATGTRRHAAGWKTADQAPRVVYRPAARRPKPGLRDWLAARVESFRRRYRPLLWGSAGLAVAVTGLGLQADGYVDRAVAGTGAGIEATLVGAGFALSKVTIDGRRRTPQADIESAVAEHWRRPIFLVDPGALRDRLEALPWVREAAVRRIFPGQLVITVVEREPFALWQDERRITLIDRDGAPILSKGWEEWQHLPIVIGPEAPRHAAAIVAALEDHPGIRQETLAAQLRANARRWDLRLRNGVLVQLPEQDMGAAMDELAGLLRDHGAVMDRIEVIDLRIPDLFTIRFEDGTADRLVRGQRA